MANKLPFLLNDRAATDVLQEGYWQIRFLAIPSQIHTAPAK